jgi:hypothetical protein
MHLLSFISFVILLKNKTSKYFRSVFLKAAAEAARGPFISAVYGDFDLRASLLF